MNKLHASIRRQIKSFVRDRLGCNCPDAVFEDIRVANHSGLFTPDTLIYDIGGRLFVAILVPADWRDIETGLGDLVDAGIQYRDQHAYNRFRLVIATGDDAAIDVLQSRFSALDLGDDRVHLHVITPEQLPFDVAAESIR